MLKAEQERGKMQRIALNKFALTKHIRAKKRFDKMIELEVLWYSRLRRGISI